MTFKPVGEFDPLDEPDDQPQYRPGRVDDYGHARGPRDWLAEARRRLDTSTVPDVNGRRRKIAAAAQPAVEEEKSPGHLTMPAAKVGAGRWVWWGEPGEWRCVGEVFAGAESGTVAWLLVGFEADGPMVVAAAERVFVAVAQ